MSWIDIIGFAAALSVLSSFCMTTMLALRSFALLSNVLFILYGLSAHLYPVFLLHVILFPINLVKLHRIQGKSSFAANRGSHGFRLLDARRPRLPNSWL